MEQDAEVQGKAQKQMCCLRKTERLPGKISDVQDMFQIKLP